MKTDIFFKEAKNKENVQVLTEVDREIANLFIKKYSQFEDRFFFEQFLKSGGIIIDNWIRIYGCGKLNVIEKNERYNSLNVMDILIGEDILGGLFALKNQIVYYYAPDTREWENMGIYYTQFLDWFLNNQMGVNRFYELYRWNNWQEDCKKVEMNQGFHFYPLLQTEYNIEQRSRKIISIDEIIKFNLGI